ncbi:MFS transporter [Candidatus Harpocratesius sp.]
MRIIPPKDIFTRKGWFSILSCFLAATILWGSHFIFEFIAVIESELPLWSVGMSYLGCIIGGVFALTIFQKIPHYLIFFVSIAMFGIFQITLQIALQLTNSSWLVLLSLGGIGLSGSSFFGVMFTQLSPAFPDPKYNGRVNGLGYMAMNFIILVFGIVTFLKSPLLLIILLVLSIIGIISMGLSGHGDNKFPKQQPFKTKLFSVQPQSGSKLLMAFFWGFFLTNPFYAAINLIIHGEFKWSLPQFYLIFFFIIAIGSILNGILLDIWGRKKVMLFGIGVLSFAFFALIISIKDSILGIIFPMILGVGTTFFLTSNSLIFLEFTDKRYIRAYMMVYYIFSAIGMLGGILLGFVLESLYLSDPIYLTVVLLFLFILATITTSQIEETLPKKEELEWKDAIQRISILYKSGIPIYSQNICQISNSSVENQEPKNLISETKEELLSGTLVTVSSILDEIVSSRKSLKVIKREEMSILIEEYQNVLMVVFTRLELSKIRQKMQEFLKEFGDFFEEALHQEITDQTVFYPTKKLVHKHFFYYW